jgi:hypothetical protein
VLYGGFCSRWKCFLLVSMVEMMRGMPTFWFSSELWTPLSVEFPFHMPRGEQKFRDHWIIKESFIWRWW